MYDELFRSFVSGIEKDIGYVLDLGGATPHSGPIKREHIGSGVRYFSMDYSLEKGPHVVGDIHHLPFKDGAIHHIVCSAVLEHVMAPWKAAAEMHRVLWKGGRVFGFVPFLYPYHSDPLDYYRFTEHGIRYLFKDFEAVRIASHGGYFHTVVCFLVGFRELRIRLYPIARLLESATAFVLRNKSHKRWRGSVHSLRRSTWGHDFLAVK